jgi:hypothetical protein
VISQNSITTVQNEGPAELPALFVEKQGLQITATLGKILPEDPHHLADGNPSFFGTWRYHSRGTNHSGIIPPGFQGQRAGVFSLER